MPRYPLSVLEGTSAEALTSVLRHHVREGARILDPCCGDSIWWDPRELSRYAITLCDILPPYEQDLFTLLADHPGYRETFDCVVYDPPYLIDAPAKGDPRGNKYGGYDKSKGDLQRYQEALRNPLRDLLVEGGTLIVKCQDQYLPRSRTFALHHYEWLKALEAARYAIRDFFVYRYHRASPTAYQVRDRPCSVIAHSYLIVAVKDGTPNAIDNSCPARYSDDNGHAHTVASAITYRS